MTQRFELYLAQASPVHQLDPRSKLALALAVGAAGLLFRHIAVLAGLLILAHLGLLVARIPLARIRWLWARLAPLLVMILILQPLFAPGKGPDLVHVGVVRLTWNGILDGVSFALRAAALAFVAGLFLLTTEPATLVQGLGRLGLPYSWGLTIGLSIRYLPTTFGLFVSVSEAQQARGWLVGQGNLIQRARSYLPILVATIIAALRLSDNLGLALAARGLGYPAQRTSLRDLRFTVWDWLVTVVAVLSFGGLLLVRFGLSLGAAPW